MAISTISLWEYRNDFFSIVIREHSNRPGSYIFCSGISIPRFNPLCWQRTGICSNPAFKGLQLLRANVSHFAISRGMRIGKPGASCETDGHKGDGWYQEDPLLIEGASPDAIEEIIEFSARDLVQSVLNACRSDVKMPDKHLTPEEMQQFLESISA